MDGRRQRRQPFALEDPAPVAGDLDAWAEQGLGGGRAKANDRTRAHDLDLPVQPGPAGGDLAAAGLLVQPALALLAPTEVLHGVGEVDIARVDAGLLERLREDPAGGTDEGLSGEV